MPDVIDKILEGLKSTANALRDINKGMESLVKAHELLGSTVHSQQKRIKRLEDALLQSKEGKDGPGNDVP